MQLHTLEQLNRCVSADGAPQWRLQELEGRLVQIADPQPAAALSFAFLLIREAQAQNRLAVWIGSDASSFYPPDAAAFGIDMKNLPVLRMANRRDACRAAETVLRDGAFQVAVIDLEHCRRVHSATLARLHALVRRHQSCAVLVTGNPVPGESAGPLISLRARTGREHRGRGEFTCRIHAVRDKRRGAEWSQAELFCGVDGYY